MAYNLIHGVPLFGTRFTKTILTSFAVVPGAEYGKNKLSYMEDTYFLARAMSGRISTGWSTSGIKDCYYNQITGERCVTQNGLEEARPRETGNCSRRAALLLISSKSIRTRQAEAELSPRVRIDSAAQMAMSQADIEAGLAAEQHHVVARGRRRVPAHRWRTPSEHLRHTLTGNSSEPGLGKAAADWLAGQKVILCRRR